MLANASSCSLQQAHAASHVVNIHEQQLIEAPLKQTPGVAALQSVAPNLVHDATNVPLFPSLAPAPFLRARSRRPFLVKNLENVLKRLLQSIEARAESEVPGVFPHLHLPLW